MSLYTYVSSPNPNLICCICQAPFLQPVTTLTCFHTFCHDCILQALSHASICPIDRTPLCVDDLGRVGGIVESLVDELIVSCPHFASGCTTTTQRQSMAHHLMEECVWAEVECTVLGCMERVARGKMDVHMKDVHGMKDDEKYVKEVKTTRNDEAHTSTDGSRVPPSQPLEIQSSSKLTFLTEQNILLLHRVSTLESTVRDLKREMESVRGVLGPWLRSARQTQPQSLPRVQRTGGSPSGNGNGEDTNSHRQRNSIDMSGFRLIDSTQTVPSGPSSGQTLSDVRIGSNGSVVATARYAGPTESAETGVYQTQTRALSPPHPEPNAETQSQGSSSIPNVGNSQHSEQGYGNHSPGPGTLQPGQHPQPQPQNDNYTPNPHNPTPSSANNVAGFTNSGVNGGLGLSSTTIAATTNSESPVRTQPSNAGVSQGPRRSSTNSIREQGEGFEREHDARTSSLQTLQHERALARSHGSNNRSVNDDDDFASYFPRAIPDLDDVRIRQFGGGVMERGEGHGHRTSYSSGEHAGGVNGFYSNPTPPTPAVGLPTLESTLANLEAVTRRNDLALVSLEASARRNEMALSNLANENLRMGEELVGLRAGVYGLRMQMCGVLMDRDRERGLVPVPIPGLMMRPGVHPSMAREEDASVHRFGVGPPITKL